jgi:phosphodiesterase/alkaline phosphatase D-like protein
MRRQLYRYSLRLGTASDGLFRQRMRLSIFLRDNRHGVSIVRAGDSHSKWWFTWANGLLTKRKRTGSFRLPKA